MWQQYRRTFWIMQVFILGMCVVGRLFAGMPWPAVVFLWIALQLGSLAGAWWGSKLRNQLDRDSKGLPLEGKLR